MSGVRPSWRCYDPLRQKVVGGSSYRSPEQCQQAIAGFIARGERGGRPDLSLDMLRRLIPATREDVPPDAWW